MVGGALEDKGWSLFILSRFLLHGFIP